MTVNDQLALIFDRMDIDTNAVLDAAGTKWNFLKYKPDLIGGHCIGVALYYLAHKAESLGYHLQVILFGRRVNDNMGMFTANKVIKLMIRNGHKIDGASTLILDIPFKENCPDIRNSRVIDIYRELRQFGVNVDVNEPDAGKEKVKEEYGIDLIEKPDRHYDAMILAVARREFNELDFKVLKNGKQSVIFDTKAFLERGDCGCEVVAPKAAGID